MNLANWWRKKMAALYAWIAEDAKNDPSASYAEYAKARKAADEAARRASKR